MINEKVFFKERGGGYKGEMKINLFFIFIKKQIFCR